MASPEIFGPKPFPGTTPRFSSPGTARVGPNLGPDGGRGILTFKASSAGIEAKIRRLKSQNINNKNAALRVNQLAVKKLSSYAERELKRRIKGRGRQQSRNQALLDLAGKPEQNSSVTSDGFHFFDPKVIRYSRAFPYYRAIELGSRHMVGHRVPLVFLRGGTAVPPPSARLKEVTNVGGQPGGRNYRPGGGTENRARRALYSASKGPNGGFVARNEVGDAQRDYGTYSGRRGAYVVTIRRPIRAYHYISTAVNTFRSSGDYTKIVERQMNMLRGGKKA